MKLPDTILGYPVREVSVLEGRIIAVISVDDVIDQAAIQSDWIELTPTRIRYPDGTEEDLHDQPT